MRLPRMMIVRSPRDVLLVVVALCGGLVGCKDPAATATPKAVALQFAKAFTAGDVQGALDTSTGDENSGLVLEASLNSVNAHRRLAAAAEKRFGKGANVFGVRSSADSDLAQAVERGQEKVDGDAATVGDPASKQTLRLKKVNGAWKVDRSPLTQTGGTDIGRMLPKVQEMTIAYRDLAAELEAGKYKSANEAMAALRVKFLKTQGNRVPVTLPATAPGAR